MASASSGTAISVGLYGVVFLERFKRAVFIFDQVRLGFIPGVTYQLAAAGFVPLLITELCAAVTAEKQAGEKVSAAPAGVLGSSLKFSHGLIISLCVDNRLMESRIFFAVVDDHAGIRLPQKNLACETFVFQTEDLSDVGQGVSLQIQFIEAAHGLRVGVGRRESAKLPLWNRRQQSAVWDL